MKTPVAISRSLVVVLALVVSSCYQTDQIAREAALRANLATLRDGLGQYHADTGRYPDSLQELVARKYLRAIPADPITRRSDTWLTESASAGLDGSGVANIRSGAEGVATDGTPYRSW